MCVKVDHSILPLLIIFVEISVIPLLITVDFIRRTSIFLACSSAAASNSLSSKIHSLNKDGTLKYHYSNATAMYIYNKAKTKV